MTARIAGIRSALVWRAALVFAVAFGVFAARTRGPYHFDDWVTPVGDPASQSLGALVENLTKTLRPIAKLSFAIEGSLGLGDAPAIRRGVSAVIHGVSSSLLLLLCARLGAGLWAALLGALLFAVHPIHAELVWALAGRGALLGLAFVLGALLAQLARRFWLAAGLLAAACLARETWIAGVLPLLALELARRRDGLRGFFRRIEPSLAVVLLGIAFVVQNARYRQLIDYSARGRPFAFSVAGQIEAIPLGVSLYVRPSALSIDHGEALSRTFGSGRFWVGIAILVALFALLGFAVVKRRRAVAVGSALLLAALLPTQTVIPKLDALTERPFAVALAGFVVLVSIGIHWATRRRSSRRWIVAASLSAGLVLSERTLARGRLYASDVALWRDAAEKSVENPRPHLNLALALLEEGRAAEAERALTRARQIDPFDSEMRALAARLALGLSSPPR